ncbi:MAG: hypothetical protein DMG41_38870 [Acidobacteria bacterium]|nr:MAG: hypothetical protein DMG41_38870 [Acidobacteriota bacterium]
MLDKRSADKGVVADTIAGGSAEIDMKIPTRTATLKTVNFCHVFMPGFRDSLSISSVRQYNWKGRTDEEEASETKEPLKTDVRKVAPITQ